MLVGPASAGAATIPVAPGAVNVTADGQCSLVEAIQNANNDLATFADCAAGSGTDTLALDGASTYTLNTVNNNFFGPNGLPIVTSQIVIDGDGGTIARDSAAPPFRLFIVDAGGDLVIGETVLSNGLARGGDGGDDVTGDDGGGGGGGAGLGGGIYNRGRLTLTSSTVTGNTARGGDGGDGGVGAGGDDGGGAGGGGLGGAGGTSSATSSDGGNGGGGFAGIGGAGVDGGGGGGGTDNNGNDATTTTGGTGGTQNGGTGGNSGFNGVDGGLGGGGGAGGDEGDGGDGGFGGGGGGGGENDNAIPNFAGDGGYGGGGGGGGEDSSGGNGGFGGGGGGADGQTAGQTTGTGGFAGGNGGALSNQSGGGGGGGGLGGGVFNDGGAVSVQNSTLSGNAAQGGAGGAGTPGGVGQAGQPGRGLGGAIFSHNGELTVGESTLTDNPGEVGGLFFRREAGQNGSLNLTNSILAGGAERTNDCVVEGIAGTASGAGNLIEVNLGCAGVASNAEPQLGPLADNGGFTPTQLPAIGSPVVNTADPGSCTNSDQRGEPRPVGPGCDIGSVETAPEVDRTLGIKYKGNAFKGTLKSNVQQCVTGKVKVFEKQKGKDPKLASDTVDAAGKYKAKEPNLDPGKFYAQINEQQVAEITCLAGQSKAKKLG